MGLISYTKIKDGDNATGNLFNAPLETLYNEFNGNIGSVNIQNSAITGAKIADSTITPTKLDLTQKYTFAVTESTTSTSTLTPSATKDLYIITAQAATLTIAEPTGTPIEGQSLIFRIKDNGTARTLSWNAVYRAVGVTIPTATVANKIIYVGAIWNSTESKWDVIAVSKQV